MLRLFDYFRSSACYRVRIALNLKNIPYQQMPVHLVKGQQSSENYKAINPQQLVPALQDPKNNAVITQSLAIIEYLEEAYPETTLLPHDLIERAQVRAFAQVVTCDIHPVNNLRVLKYLKHTFHISDEQKMQWYFHWLESGFEALEATLKANNHGGSFCFGKTPTLADICLVPQVYNALRFEFPFDKYPHILQVATYCNTQPAFIKALPENQPDAE